MSREETRELGSNDSRYCRDTPGTLLGVEKLNFGVNGLPVECRYSVTTFAK
jgi:hypothetical protein